MEGWAFGCDICQQVCPWNRFSEPHRESEFTPKPELMAMSADDWRGMTEVVFDRLFEGIEAGAILRDGKAVGRYAFKWGATGSVTCWLQLWGAPMVKSRRVTNGDYDKQAHALADAALKLVRDTTYNDDHAVSANGTAFARAIVEAGDGCFSKQRTALGEYHFRLQHVTG
jgi:hypothetical protein